MATKDDEINSQAQSDSSSEGPQLSPPGHKSTVQVKLVDSDEPTEEELVTLPRVPGRLPFTAYTIAFVEMCERLSFCGTVTVFMNFIQQPLPKGSPSGAGFEGQSGALGMGQGIAFAIVTCKETLNFPRIDIRTAY
jgi:POT family proton-dependent oligopeptide transporter